MDNKTNITFKEINSLVTLTILAPLLKGKIHVSLKHCLFLRGSKTKKKPKLFYGNCSHAYF